MTSGGVLGNSSCHTRAWRQASFSTHRPMGTMSPVSSVSPMNESGWSRPRFSCCQRMSASTSVILPVSSRRMGW